MATLVPEVHILIVGDAECGKSTLLAYLPHARHGSLSALPLREPIRDSDLPLTFHVSLFARPYTFHLFSTSSPNHLAFPSLPDPDMVILAYDISSRPSLHSIRQVWHKQLQLHFAHLEERLPIMLLGLKRDLRAQLQENEIVLPQAGHAMAQMLRCDSYAECSAVTGELLWEVLEDVTKMAAKTTTENGAKSDGTWCNVM